MAKNVSVDRWASHADLIAKLYIDKHWSWDQIAKHLTEIGFNTKYTLPFGLQCRCAYRLTIRRGPTVKANVQKSWGIRRFSSEEELEILARCLLHHRDQGRDVSFVRFGNAFPVEEIEYFILRNPRLQPSDLQLPVHLKISCKITGFRSGEQLSVSRNNSICALPFERSSTCLHVGATYETRESILQRLSFPARPISDRGTCKWHCSTAQDDEADSSNGAMHSRITNTNILKTRELERAITTIRRLSKDLGLDHTDIATIFLIPDMFDFMTEEWRLNLLRLERKETLEKVYDWIDVKPLHHASEHDLSSTVEHLLNWDVDVESRDEKARTALHIAASRGSLRSLIALVRYQTSRSNLTGLSLTDGNGRTPLMLAIESGYLDCAAVLVGVVNRISLLSTDKDGQTALHLACLKGMGSILSTMLSKIARPLHNAGVDTQDCQGSTPLHLAVSRRSAECVRLLLSNSACCNIQDGSGRTPVHLACMSGDVSLVQMLIRQDHVNLSLVTSGSNTVLHLLCQRDLYEEAEEVLRSGKVDINAQNLTGYTPLMAAANNRSADTCRMLISYGADPCAHRSNVIIRDELDWNGQDAREHAATEHFLANLCHDGRYPIADQAAPASYSDTLLTDIRPDGRLTENVIRESELVGHGSSSESLMAQYDSQSWRSHVLC